MLYVRVIYLLHTSLTHFETAKFIIFGIMGPGNVIATFGQTTLVKAMCTYRPLFNCAVVTAFRVELLIQPISGEIRFQTVRQWFHIAFEADTGQLLGGFYLPRNRKNRFARR
jgi:hypothetical protein